MFGDLGHFLLLLAFVSIGLSGCGFALHSRYKTRLWWRYGCATYALHAAALLGAIALLLHLLISDSFAYHYPWRHSMASLPLSYKIAALWEGQEGSFLLWMFWQLIFGTWLIRSRSRLRSESLVAICLVQLCIGSMLLGVVVGGWKIGSSPFLLLREAISVPVFASDPEFVPTDGTGLSPLLQNYWMVIHPPILFMGFALVALPFAKALAGLWKKDIDTALREAKAWVMAAVLVLGVGVTLGAVWAYETLNFGGYWNWDPVENAVYVPWLVLVASLHMLILYTRRGVAARGSLYSIFAAFWLVLYATFLIRSGILGNTSVHAFTDAGLSGQLIAFICLIVALSLGTLYLRRKILPTQKFNYSVKRIEIYLAVGVACLSLMAFQVLLPTSLPVWNAVLTSVGFESNLAPPADAVAFYSNAQLYFAVALLLLSGAGQLVYWQRAANKAALLRLLMTPLTVSLLVSALALLLIYESNTTTYKLSEPRQLSWIFLLSAGVYALVANGYTLLVLLRRQPTRSAGALTHTGFALMILGILFSSAYERILSTNHTGLIWHKDFPEEVNTNDILLFQHQLRQMKGYSLHYKGTRRRIKGMGGYVAEAKIEPLSDPKLVRAKVDFSAPSSARVRKGDTLELEDAEKIYFEILYQPEQGSPTYIYPSAQKSSEDESILYAPYILRQALGDIYTHVRTYSLPEQTEWSKPQTIEVAPDEQFFANDYVARVLSLRRLSKIEGVPLDTGDIALGAKIEVLGPEHPYYLRPVFVIRDKEVGLIPDESPDLGLRVSLTGVHPERNRIELQLHSSQAPWIILEIVKKPLINLLWGGGFIMMIGIVVGLLQYIRPKSTT